MRVRLLVPPASHGGARPHVTCPVWRRATTSAANKRVRRLEACRDPRRLLVFFFSLPFSLAETVGLSF